MLKPYIQKVIEGKNLTRAGAKEAMGIIMSGEATSAQIACFITALRLKGETPDEISGCAEAMREKAANIKIERSADTNIDTDEKNVDGSTLIDTCGTGGDCSNTFNISTTSAFVVSGAGVTVAKHGNRSVSSKCGSADVMKELGVNIEIPPEKVKECIEKVGIGFMFAPMFHSAMKHAIGPRREIGIRTIFNILGPLTNPAGANVQMLGVYKPELTELMAAALKKLGAKSAMVVYGEGGMDEISISGKTIISRLKSGKIETITVAPEDFGFKKRPLSSIKGGDAARNAEIIRDVLDGEKSAARAVAILNASAALTAAGKAGDFKQGAKLAAESIDSGAAKRKLALLIQVSNS